MYKFKLSHLAVQVSDFDRSVAFYVDCLRFNYVGMRVTEEPYSQRLTGYTNVKQKQAFLTFPGDDRPPGIAPFFEIFEYQNVDKKAVDPSLANPGTTHFGLYVDDLDSEYARLKAKGVEFLSEVITATGGVNKGGKVVFAKDPDGIRVELIQIAKPPLDLTVIRKLYPQPADRP